MTVVDEKRSLRQQTLQKRELISTTERAAKSKLAVGNLLTMEALSTSQTVMVFLPFGSEIDTRPFIEVAQERGQEIWLPVTNQQERRIIPYVYTSEEVLRTGVYGIREPDPTKAKLADPAQLDAVVLPGVAFDREGGRLGYGGGYYDAFLASLLHRPLLIGFCFTEQIVTSVPREEHDFSYDYLVADSGIYR